ncbi:hypothetical protein Ahy_A03g013992 isoform C [Arachis hypogaea]|uniref:Uncharacterized protein n=1 Tax=Arachis hypogaea TaxID=3818 RepID=A0A445DWR1_ARAHY|nr:hypothetical protein Ahy_A03g013992 isoform C [Arachis hypogaea]
MEIAIESSYTVLYYQQAKTGHYYDFHPRNSETPPIPANLRGIGPSTMRSCSAVITREPRMNNTRQIS